MTKNKIIEATIRNFAAHGYQGTTMRKIAEEVGIKPASIYYFFPGKRELFIAAIREILHHHFTHMTTTFEYCKSEKVSILFSELLEGLVTYHLKNEQETNAYIRILSSPIEDIKKEVQAYLVSYNTWFVDRLMETIGDQLPDLHESEAQSIIDHYVFIGNGLFWGVVIYDQEELRKNLDIAVALMNQHINQIIGSD